MSKESTTTMTDSTIAAADDSNTHNNNTDDHLTALLPASHPTNPIRHSGRALVRGKIRRVWRPRHLEVWDNGLVRYYEVPIPANSTLDAFVPPYLPPHDDTLPHSKIPKCTLAIHHARIIDVTTLRDMHVGLPRGAFGFLFHGQQIDEEGTGGGGEEDLFSDGMQLLSMGQCQGNANLATPRDFLCAVNSLEEAQSWVIALQWAASMSRDASLHSGSTHSLPYSTSTDDPSWDPQHQEDSIVASPPRQRQQQSSPEQQTAKTTTTLPNINKPKAGKMIVTKVVGYTLVRLETYKWEIAYRIHVLLVMPRQQQQQVQEWSILRTALDMADIIILDKQHVPLSPKVQAQLQRIRDLPTLHKMEKLTKSVAVVDSVLRSFCMEAGVVNSPSMKRFLGLQSSSSSLQPHATNSTRVSQFWAFHGPSGVLSRPKRTILQQQSIDQFVKQWLQQAKPKDTTPSKRFSLLCWYLRLPQPTTTYAAGLLLFAVVSAISPASVEIDSSKSITYYHATSHQTQQPPQPKSPNKSMSEESVGHSTVAGTPHKSLMDEDDDSEAVEDEEGEESSPRAEAVESTSLLQQQDSRLSSPLPMYDADHKVTVSCWSKPDDSIFNVRGPTYLTDRVKMPSGKASFTCEGVDMWLSDTPERHIARHPSVSEGVLANTDKDMFLVNFLLPFGNFVAYFSIPPLEQFANPQLADVWTRFVEGNQQYRDARLKMLPVVVDGPWIVRAAVPGTSPALLGKVIPLQYFFTQKPSGRSIYEVDVIITASSIAKGILSVVKSHTKALSIAFAFIIEAAEEHELPETVLASFQVHSVDLEDCPLLPSLSMP
ncbi:Protein of unknown function (DUF1336) [Seminavis robusta]|uniref:Protein ENHANCED DISEASE RESISTANCE 2 C-terminal domain-containing protein n=1 Tax=Seminavis robusta TaxID=568900 RepID=A0A9N8DXU5_9STRA|nr:Protein of unknown function (DUF1336) [Seminavis robusta]|eukprot:Sro459_g147310.1 Protein of unknown function (DUF1336) (825) ;mRNA; f:36661-39233